MGSVPSCPCRGELSLLSLLTAHAKVNPFVSKTQGGGLQATPMCKAFLSRIQACMRVPAPPEPSGVPPHSRSVPALAVPWIFQSFHFTDSYPGLLLWPGVGMSLGDSDIAQCKCTLDTVNEPDRKGWWLRSTTRIAWLESEDLINTSQNICICSERLACVLTSLRKSLGLLRRQPFELVPRGKIASLKKRIQTGFLLSCFCFNFSIDVMSKLQKSYKNSTKDSHMLFPQIHRLFTFCDMCFIILSVHLFF